MRTDFSDWTPRDLPGMEVLVGRTCQLEPFDVSEHAGPLFNSVAAPGNEDIWTFLPDAHLSTPETFGAGLMQAHTHIGWQTMVIRRLEDHAILGMASYMRNRPEHGSTEVGCVAYSHALQRTTIGTEAIYLMAAHVFDQLGYRRFEWKCHNDNAASHAAAKRYGFLYEGIFRNDMIIKNKSRDTAWYAMTDGDWSELKAAFLKWLDPNNFDEAGKQKERLESFR